jgi:Zn-dependent M28 family amino/carboxypeptidase
MQNSRRLKIMIQYLNLINILGLFFIFCAVTGCASTASIYPDNDIRIENMKDTVKYLSALNPPRNYLNTESLNKAEYYITHEFTKYGITTEQQPFEVSGNLYKNIIASVGPKEGDRIVVGAHYDVCGNQPGADDNASAIAGLLEIARLVKIHEKELPYRINFVAYTLEEPPFFRTKNMGSYIHARFLSENKKPVKGMICLEMIGFYSDQKNSQRYPLSLMRLFYRNTGDFIGVISNYGSSSLAKQVSRNLRATSIKVEKLKAPSFLTGVDFSDHRNFWEFGYDAVMITDTAFYRNPNYHEPTDTIETLDFNRMKQVVKGICWSLINMK